MPPAPEPALHLYRSTKGGMGISHEILHGSKDQIFTAAPPLEAHLR